MTALNSNKRELSPQAQVAKRIRDYAKSLGVKCRATSDSFSMGDSVNWAVENIHPDLVKKIEEFASDHQYGHFDGMTDMYEYSNSRKDIPQTKFCHGGCKYTPDMRQKALDWLRLEYPGNYKNIPHDYDEAKKYSWVNGDQSWNSSCLVENHVREVLSGDDFHVKNWREFWSSLRVASPVSVISGSAHIEKHTHTKKGFQMFLVVMADHVDRDDFNRLRDEAKTLGGWYSRKWGSTPCGFAFKDQSIAEQFLSEQFGGVTPPTGAG